MFNLKLKSEDGNDRDGHQSFNREDNKGDLSQRMGPESRD